MNRSSGSLNIQNYLRAFSIQRLEEEFCIHATRSVKYPNLVLFKYDQIESPSAAPIVREARGIILDEANGWSIVARSFDRFFNVGDPHAAEVTWENCRVQEKLDGSLMQMYWYNDQWNVATSGNPDAAGNVNGFDMTFETLFWDTFRALGLDRFHYPKTFTVVWELTSPYNKVVVQHKEPKLTLIGLRSLTSGYEWTVAKAAELGIIIPIMGQTVDKLPIVKEFPLTCMADVLAACKALRGFEQEGFVVVDCDFRRVKVKSPSYVLAHKLRDKMCSRRAYIEVVLQNEDSELIAYFPETAAILSEIRHSIAVLAGAIDATFHSLDPAMTQKDFALKATKYHYSAALFAVRAGKCHDGKSYLMGLAATKLAAILDEQRSQHGGTQHKAAYT